MNIPNRRFVPPLHPPFAVSLLLRTRRHQGRGLRSEHDIDYRKAEHPPPNPRARWRRSPKTASGHAWTSWVVSSGFGSFGSVGRRAVRSVATSACIPPHAASRKYANSRRSSIYLVARSGLKVRTSQPGASTSTIHCPTHSRHRSVTGRTPIASLRLGMSGTTPSANTLPPRLGRLRNRTFTFWASCVAEIDHVGPHRLRLDHVPCHSRCSWAPQSWGTPPELVSHSGGKRSWRDRGPRRAAPNRWSENRRNGRTRRRRGEQFGGAAEKSHPRRFGSDQANETHLLLRVPLLFPPSSRRDCRLSQLRAR